MATEAERMEAQMREVETDLIQLGRYVEFPESSVIWYVQHVAGIRMNIRSPEGQNLWVSRVRGEDVDYVNRG